MNFQDFKNRVKLPMDEICLDIYRENRDSIKIKKETVVVKNLVTIFETALKLSNAGGFQSMSLRDLSRETGLSMGALYSYFSSKEELLEIILGQGRRISIRVLVDQVDDSRAPLERLHSAIRVHLYLSELLQPWFYFAYMEAKNLSKEEQQKSIATELATEKIFIDILEEGAREGLFKIQSEVLTASAIKALLQDWYLKRWKYKMRKVSIDDYTGFVLEMIDRIILVS